MKAAVGLVCLMCGISLPAMSADSVADKPISLRELARAYEHGEGVTRNPAKAVALYCEAAAEGDVEAQFNLGWMHANGRGVKRDDATAAYFFSMAAQKGDRPSANMLRFVGEPPTEPPECMEKALYGDMQSAKTEQERRLIGLIKRLSPEYGVHPRLALAVARTESNLNPSARSEKNAQGIMQLIPETAERFNVKRPYDPEQNVRGGLSYLRWLLAYFEGEVPLVVAAYNAGEGAVNQYKGIPPYAETREYVSKIMRVHKKEKHPFDVAVTGPSPAIGSLRWSRYW